MDDAVVRVDARWLSCPEPVMMAKEALAGVKSGKVEVLVDTEKSRERVMRLGESMGCWVSSEERSDGYAVTIDK
ncbi:MAG: sulfurtransferase TusA family protein [Synergistaceae bacterium]|jgi:TusA-related sulfurtransferase|nr:sulfurtransferase TusA family protein [Synergistaceae bacterium]